jgi:VIT1/CCC1 family predicted Fe2+/Mn2+ transporter
MKKHTIYFTLVLLLATFINSCGVKKAVSYDRFGGGFSDNKSVYSNSVEIAEKAPQMRMENSTERINKPVLGKSQTIEKKLKKIEPICNTFTSRKFNNIFTPLDNNEKRKNYKSELVNDNPKILKQSGRLFLVSDTVMALGGLIIMFSPVSLLNLGLLIVSLGFIMLCLAFVMALTGWLQKLKKNQSSRRITFGHVLLGLILLALVILLIVLSGSSGGGMFSPF